mmetsp:Transcript_56192/g.162859  ORF Transcript_56192/g.162859 Transcript_56192/m.162859 type:complete len:298 (-) Transcript_56192:297-1190(-)
MFMKIARRTSDFSSTSSLSPPKIDVCLLAKDPLLPASPPPVIEMAPGFTESMRGIADLPMDDLPLSPPKSAPDEAMKLTPGRFHCNGASGIFASACAPCDESSLRKDAFSARNSEILLSRPLAPRSCSLRQSPPRCRRSATCVRPSTSVCDGRLSLTNIRSDRMKPMGGVPARCCMGPPVSDHCQRFSGNISMSSAGFAWCAAGAGKVLSGCTCLSLLRVPRSGGTTSASSSSCSDASIATSRADASWAGPESAREEGACPRVVTGLTSCCNFSGACEATCVRTICWDNVGIVASES